MKKIMIRSQGDVEEEKIGDIKRRILFSPAVTGNRYIKFAIAVAEPGAQAPLHTHPGEEAALTLSGEAKLLVYDEAYEVSEGVAVLIPPGVSHAAVSVGKEKWIVISAYCDECPLLRDAQTSEPYERNS